MAVSMAPRTDGIVTRGRLITLNVVLVDCWPIPGVSCRCSRENWPRNHVEQVPSVPGRRMAQSAEASSYTSWFWTLARWPEEISEWPHSHCPEVGRASSKNPFREPEVAATSCPLFAQQVTPQPEYSPPH